MKWFRKSTPAPAAPLTHYNIFGNPLSTNWRDLACDFQPTEGQTVGVTSERQYVTCPDCLLRLELAR